MKNFTSVHDVNNIKTLVQTALESKKNPFASEIGKNKTLGLLFFNPSLRTRLSTQKAANNLGMSIMSMDLNAHGWKLEFEDGAIMNSDKAEHIKEGAAVISQYCDVIGVRTFPTLTDREKDYQELILNQFIKYATVPVISLESATRHPLQSLTDLMTIREHQKTERPKVVLTWAPHPKALPQAVANSFAEWMISADMDLTITHPKGYELSSDFVENTPVEYNQAKAFENADFVYAKNWSSFNDYGKIIKPKENWMITAEKMTLTNDAYFMHCLPVRRNVVVADEVIDSKKSLVIQQSNNRTFAAQAVLRNLL
jgi:N-succinyl-L-ornithine transcarbamylase